MSSNDDQKQMRELLRSVRRHARFSYRIDGPTEIEEAFDAAMKENFGPNANRKQERWVARLRRLGLIPPRKA